ncbi:MAG: DUF1232 domain-containing protein, partial [bacterium]
VSGIARGVAHIPHFFKLFFRLLGDPRVPFIAKVVPGAAFLYLLSPFDLIPDFIFPLGLVEDIVILYFAFRFLFRAAPEPVVREHVRRIEMRQ